MPCDPKPGLWAYLVCALSALLAHPLQFAAFVLLLGSAVTAALLALRRADHGPIAWALGAVFVADLVGVLLAPALSSPGPFGGWQRLLFHVDEARFLAWFAALQFVVGLSFVEPSARAQTRSLLRVALGPFYGLMLAICVACYPALRGDALAAFYACLHANAILWSLAVAGGWVARRRTSILQVCQAAEKGSLEQLIRRDPILTPARLVASLLVALSALSAVAGPWWRGLFGARYDGERVILCALYAGIVCVQIRALTHRGAGPKPDPRAPAPADTSAAATTPFVFDAEDEAKTPRGDALPPS